MAHLRDGMARLPTLESQGARRVPNTAEMTVTTMLYRISGSHSSWKGIASWSASLRTRTPQTAIRLDGTRCASRRPEDPRRGPPRSQQPRERSSWADLALHGGVQPRRPDAPAASTHRCRWDVAPRRCRCSAWIGSRTTRMPAPSGDVGTTPASTAPRWFTSLPTGRSWRRPRCPVRVDRCSGMPAQRRVECASGHGDTRTTCEPRHRRGTFADAVACAQATSTAATGIDFDG